MKRMIINVIRNEELRIALVADDKLFDLDIERVGYAPKKSNIYKGKITSREASLEAAFVNFGSERHGFLPLKEINPSYFSSEPKDPETRPNIKEVLKEGQEVLVQVEKDERGNKGAALTTYLSIAGAYLVLMPNNPRAGGISRRIEGEERESLKEVLSQLKVPEGMGVIIRTAGVGKSLKELEWDLQTLINQWEAIKEVGEQHKAPVLIQQESDIIMRAVRDYLRHDIDEIIVDNEEVYNKIHEYLARVRPNLKDSLLHYQNPIPIYNYYQIENQIETAFLREVNLPSGGAIVIDQTEALVTIDINSARATKGSHIEETAYNTNLEAAEEIARQLRLRDIGGLVVIDFIDMNDPQHQREVENKLRDSLRIDRARTQISKISRFGLLEMSRQRLGTTLGEAHQVICSQCNGRGTIRSVEATVTSLLRLIEEEAMKPHTVQVQAQVPIEVGTYMLNEKRNHISEVQKRQNTHIIIIPNPHYTVPDYKVIRIKEGDKALYSKGEQSSHSMIETPDIELTKAIEAQPPRKAEKPVIDRHKVHKPKQAPKQSLIKRLWDSMFGSSMDDKSQKKVGTPRNRRRPSNRHPGNRSRGTGQNNRSRSGGQQRRSHSNRGQGGSGNRSTSPNRSGGNRSRQGANKPRTQSDNKQGATRAGNRSSGNTRNTNARSGGASRPKSSNKPRGEVNGNLKANNPENEEM